MAPALNVRGHFYSQKHLAPMVGASIGAARKNQDGTEGTKFRPWFAGLAPRRWPQWELSIGIGARGHSYRSSNPGSPLASRNTPAARQFGHISGTIGPFSGPRDGITRHVFLAHRLELSFPTPPSHQPRPPNGLLTRCEPALFTRFLP